MVTYPEDWTPMQLKDLGHIQMCRRIFQSQTKAYGAIPFYKISTFGSKADAYISQELYEQYKALYPYPEKGDVLISAAGTVGKTVIFDGKDSYFQDSNIVWLKVDKNAIDRKFLWWFYRSYPWEALEGTTIQRLYNSIILKTEIHLPDKPEQEIIARTLSQFDAYIDDLAELIEKKRGIRDGAINDLLSARTRILGFNKNLTRAQIGDCIIVKRGKRVTRNQLAESPRGSEIFPVYQNSVEPLGYYKESNCPPESAFIIAAGNAGSIGFLNVAFWAADDCYYFEPRTAIHQKYLYYALMNNQQEINSQTRRTSIPRLSRENVEQINILLPCIDEQKAIADVLTAMDEEIEALEIERDKMIQIREGAMDDLLTGRVRLSV
mgnify:CR=1 FL=1